MHSRLDALDNVLTLPRRPCTTVAYAEQASSAARMANKRQTPLPADWRKTKHPAPGHDKFDPPQQSQSHGLDFAAVPQQAWAQAGSIAAAAVAQHDPAAACRELTIPHGTLPVSTPLPSKLVIDLTSPVRDHQHRPVQSRVETCRPSQSAQPQLVTGNRSVLQPWQRPGSRLGRRPAPMLHEPQSSAAQAAELAPTAFLPVPPPAQPFTAQPAPVSSLLQPQTLSSYQQPTIRIQP